MDNATRGTDAMSPREGIAIGALVVTLLAILLVGASRQTSTSPTQPCTAEAQVLPDGSTVGRSAEHNCQFVDTEGNLVGK